MKLDKSVTWVIPGKPVKITEAPLAPQLLAAHHERWHKHQRSYLFEPDNSPRAQRLIDRMAKNRRQAASSIRAAFGNYPTTMTAESGRHAIVFINGKTLQVIELCNSRDAAADRRFGMIIRGFPSRALLLQAIHVTNATTRLLIQKSWKTQKPLAIHRLPIKLREQLDMTGLPKTLDRNQLWLVHYECRPEVIRTSVDGNGFFAPGQEPCWGFSNVATWVRQIQE